MTMMILFRWGGIINFQPQVFFLAGGGGMGEIKKFQFVRHLICTQWFFTLLYVQYNTIQYFI